MTINVVLFLANRNIYNYFPIMPCKFSNDLFAPKKCRILQIENLTYNKQSFGYQAFNEHSADELIVAYITLLRYLSKKQGYNLRQFFLKSSL